MKEVFTAAVGIEGVNDYVAVSELINESTSTTQQLGMLALGILVSQKTGLLNTPNRHGAIYPLAEQVKDILLVRDNVNSQELWDAEPLPLIIHYNTDVTVLAGAEVKQILNKIISSPDDHKVKRTIWGVQVNGLDFVDAGGLHHIKEFDENINVIMQINRDLLDRYHPEGLAHEVVRKSGFVDWVWLDPSGGLGKELDADFILEYVKALREISPSTRVGVAGGLTAKNLSEVIGPLLEYDNQLSWDAQSSVMRVEEAESGKKFKRFDRQKAVDFLLASAELRSKYSQAESR